MFSVLREKRLAPRSSAVGELTSITGSISVYIYNQSNDLGPYPRRIAVQTSSGHVLTALESGGFCRSPVAVTKMIL